MAYTGTLVRETVFGNMRATILRVSADAASGSVDSQMGYVEGFSLSPVSMGTAAIKIKPNLDATSATANGKIFVSSAVSGDDFFLTIYGR